MKVRLKAGIYTSAGKLHKINEDFYLFNNEVELPTDEDCIKGAKMKLPALFAVCDGLGGLNNGKMASTIVINKIAEQLPYITNSSDNIDVNVKLENIIQYCNASICNEKQNMGSTLALVFLTEKEIWFSNVGDSRIYNFYDNQLIQLSLDHNCSRELINIQIDSEDIINKHRSKNELTQYLGIHPSEFIIDPYKRKMSYKPGKTVILLCSDGVNESLADEQISKILRLNKHPKKIAKQIVKEAIDNGSKDNATALILNILCD